MNKNFKGHTFFLNKSFNTKKITINRKKYENIKLESVDFMNKYEVYSTDQIEANQHAAVFNPMPNSFRPFVFKGGLSRITARVNSSHSIP